MCKNTATTLSHRIWCIRCLEKWWDLIDMLHASKGKLTLETTIFCAVLGMASKYSQENIQPDYSKPWSRLCIHPSLHLSRVISAVDIDTTHEFFLREAKGIDFVKSCENPQRRKRFYFHFLSELGFCMSLCLPTWVRAPWVLAHLVSSIQYI